jgi:hypothetical protein
MCKRIVSHQGVGTSSTFCKSTGGSPRDVEIAPGQQEDQHSTLTLIEIHTTTSISCLTWKENTVRMN